MKLSDCYCRPNGLNKRKSVQKSCTDLCCMGASQGALCPHGVLDAVNLLLVAPAVHHGALLGIPQCSLQGLNSLSSRPKTFLQLWKLTTQICIVTNQLEGQGGRESEGGVRDDTEGKVIIEIKNNQCDERIGKTEEAKYNTYSLSTQVELLF